MKDKKILEHIRSATEMEISDLLDAVVDRYHDLYPEWELNIFVLPVIPGEKRQKQFEDTVEFIRKHGGIYPQPNTQMSRK